MNQQASLRWNTEGERKNNLKNGVERTELTLKGGQDAKEGSEIWAVAPIEPTFSKLIG